MKKTLLCVIFLLFTTLFYCQVTNVSMCGSDSLDLSSINSDFIRNYPAGTTVTYFLSDNDAANNTNPITDPAHYKYSGPEGTVKIYGRIDDHGIITTNYFNLTVFQYVTVTASHKPILCKGDTTALALGVIGDAANYRYSINGSPFTTNNYYTNLTAGVYNIEVQNTNPICGNSTLTYTIPEPNALLATVYIENQNAIVTASGGTLPYQYSKDGVNYQNSNVFTNLIPGNYTINVRDSEGCGTIVPVNILPSLSAAVTLLKELDCIGSGQAVISVTAVGGQAPYTYSLNGGPFQASNTFTITNAGTYIITVKDAINTTSPVNTAITINPRINVDGVALATSPTNCNDASMMILATSGQAPYTYSIDNGMTYTFNNVFHNLSPGNYHFFIKDSRGCMSPPLSNTIQATIPLLVSASNTIILCHGEKASLTINTTGGQSPYQYSIDNGINYVSNNIFNALKAGTYSITVKDNYGCISQIQHVITEPTEVVGDILVEGRTITVIDVTGGIGPYQYSRNNSAFQTSNVFTNVGAGMSTIRVKDSNNCEPTYYSIEMPSEVPLAMTAAITKPADCNSNAVIEVAASGGKAPYSYSINGGSFSAITPFINLAPGTYTLTVADVLNASVSTSITVNPIIKPSFSYIIHNVQCNGATDGSIEIQPLGGSYEYSLNNGPFVASTTFNNLAAGINNTIVAKDNNGCLSDSQSFTINQPSLLTTTVVTQNQTLTVTANGGTPPYQYSLDSPIFQYANVFTVSISGTYEVYVRDANGCIATQTATIIEETPLILANATSTAIDCDNNTGTITVNVIGGKAPFIYSFDNGSTYIASNTFDGATPGTYFIRVKDAVNSEVSTTIILSAPEPIVTTAILTKAIDCANNSIVTITATGGNATYQYSVNGSAFQSSNIFTNLTAGTHTFITKDGANCTALNSLSIAPLNPLSATLSYTSINECAGNPTSTITVNAIGGQAPIQYLLNNGTYQFSNIFPNVNPGTHTVQVKDAANCMYTQTLTIVPVTSLTAVVNITKPASCYTNDAVITVEAIGGTAPYTYSIGNEFQANNNFTNLSPGVYDVTVKDSKGCVTLIYTAIAPPTPLIGTFTKTDATCYGSATGSVTMNISGGTTPYSYSLNDASFVSSKVFSNLAFGNYRITAKDAVGCTVSYDVVISQPSILETTAAILPIYHLAGGTTYGGKITLSSSGGVSPYTYTIRNNVTNSILADNNPKTVYNFVPEGSYTIITKDAFGCQIEKNNITMVLTSPIVVNAESTPISCSTNNSVITINATGGTPPYLYSSDQFTFTSANTFTVTEPGTYSVGVQDAFGILQYIDHVVKSNIPIVITAAITNVNCIGSSDGSITLTATGGTAPYTYSIGNGYSNANVFTNLTPKTYTISVKDASGCINTYSAIITQTNSLLINTVVKNNTTVDSNNGSITVTGSGGTAPYQYALKSDSNGATLIAPQNYNVFTALPVGAYNVEVIDAKGCIVTKRIVVTSDIIFGTLIIKQATCTTLGTITINAAGGKYPHQYSFDGGITYGASNIATNVADGTYTIKVKDAGGDIITLIAYITTINPIVATATLTSPISCKSSNDAVIQVTASGGKIPYAYSINGGAFQSSNTFAGLKAGNYMIYVKDSNECSRTLVLAVTEPIVLLSTAAVTNSTITVTATGGTAPYTYTLENNSGVTLSPTQTSNVFNNIPAGNYNVRVKDSRNCFFLQTGVNVIAPPTLSAFFTSTLATCNAGGTITITATGGTAPYRYSIDNGTTYAVSNVFSGLTPKNYMIMVRDAANVVATVQAVIIQAPLPVLTTNNINITCKGDNSGFITAIGSGGQAPYSYSINGSAFQSANVFTNLAAGTYILTLRDANGCTVVFANTISEPAMALQASVTVNDQTITITAQGGTGEIKYSIIPNPNNVATGGTFTNLVPGMYEIQARDQYGCLIMYHAVINPAPPTPIVEGEDKVVYEFKPGQTLADIVIEGENIKWYSSQNSSTGKTNETSLPLTTVLVDGVTYYASQTINGIESKERLAVTAKLNGSLSTPDFALAGFKFYPNPAKNILTIENSSVMDEIEIFSVSGKSVLFKKINNMHSEIDLSHVSSGVYILKVKADGKVKATKIIKE